MHKIKTLSELYNFTMHDIYIQKYISSIHRLISKGVLEKKKMKCDFTNKKIVIAGCQPEKRGSEKIED